MITLHFLSSIVNYAESTQKFDHYVIFASLKGETMGKLIKRIPGSRILTSSLPCLSLRTHVESLVKPRDSTSVLKDLPGKLDIKRHSPSFLYLPTQFD